MWTDNILKIAFSIYSNPNIYALLLGSGVSRDAGIPTGWEIVGDLINKLASANKLSPEPDPYIWYRNNFGEEPDYSKILEKITTTPLERTTILRSYFEPSEEEKERRLKVPTSAHKNIAKLVKQGYIRVILTTNFDRLIEKALEEEGITPTVISTDDTLEGALPYIHTKCTLIKLHGDYMDTRIKNTPQELSEYSQQFNTLLDRIFEEFGLIVCGWSGEWDVALRNALLRCKNRRFPMYWLAKGNITDEAKRIIDHRQAEVINIDSANSFFIQLCEKLDSLREFERPHPLSHILAETTIKRYLSEEEKYHIRIFELINGETEKVWKSLNSEYFDIQKLKMEKDAIVKRMHEYEEIMKILISMFIPIAYFDEIGRNAYLISQALERISQPSKEAGVVALIQFQTYPSLLLLYTIGITALIRENWRILKSLFLDSVYRSHRGKGPILNYVNPYYVLRGFPKEFIPRADAAREYTPENNYLFDLIYEYIKNYIPDRNKYEDLFDNFEFLSALVHIYTNVFLYGKEEDKKLLKEQGLVSAIIIGRFGWKYFGFRGHRKYETSCINEFAQSILNRGENHGLLKEGFFDGSLEVFNLCLTRYLEFLKEHGKSWF